MPDPRWKAVLEQALAKSESKLSPYALATLDPRGIPRVRHVIHRGFTHPNGRTHPLSLTTTDIRAHKAEQILSRSDAEIAWWLPGANEQFRIQAHAYLLPSPFNKHHERCLKAIGHLAPGGFDWEAERRRRFNDLSPGIRAGFAQPVPSNTPLENADEAANWPRNLPTLEDAADGAEKQTVLEALRNFAVVILDPYFVDWYQLGTSPQKRTLFSKLEGSDGWSEQAAAP